MTAYKAKVKAVHPAAKCTRRHDRWLVWNPVFVIGFGKTAFLAWVDAWRNIEKERGGK